MIHTNAKQTTLHLTASKCVCSQMLKTFRMDKTRINNILFILIEIILMFRLLCFNFFLIFAFVVVAVVVLFSNCQWVYKWIFFFCFLSFRSIFGYSSRVSSFIRFHNLFFFLLSVSLLFSTVFFVRFHVAFLVSREQNLIVDYMSCAACFTWCLWQIRRSNEFYSTF